MTIIVRSNEKVTEPAATKEAEVNAPESKDAPSATETKVTDQKEEFSESEAETTEEKEETEESEALKEGETETKEGKTGEPHKKRGGFQRRIDKLSAEKAAAKQETEYWKQQALTAGATKSDSKVETTKTAEAGKPKPESFNTHAEYVEALTDWKTDQKLNERDQRDEQKKLKNEHSKVVNTYVERKNAFAEKAKDFDEIVSDVDDIQLSAAVKEIFLTSENGPELAYELAKNRDEYARVCKLPPLAAAREIGKIEARLIKNSDGKPAETKKITSAPKPLEPVGSGKGSVKKSLADIAETGTQAEFEKAYAESFKNRRQA